MWIIFVIIVPYFGAFIYLIVEHKGMTERALSAQQESKAQFDAYVQSAAGGTDPTEQIAKAKAMLDAGTINQAEFDQLKQKALGGAPS